MDAHFSVRSSEPWTIIGTGALYMNAERSSAPEGAVRFVVDHRTMLKAYIRAIIRDPALAEDTFSDVTLAVLTSWERYDPSRPFESWARGIARRVALSNLRRESRQPYLLVEDVLEAVAQEIDEMGGEAKLESRKEALHGCLQRLAPPHRQLIEYRYFENRSYGEISGLVGKTVGNLYVIFNRLHKLLSTCIERESRHL